MDKRCAYCGAIAECREHVIPAVYYLRRTYDIDKQWIVPACEVCNILAGASVFFSVPEKAAHILTRFKLKYKKVLQTPEWTDQELSEVSYSLRKMTFAYMVAKRVALEKMKKLEETSYLGRDYLMPDFIKKEVEIWRKDHEERMKAAKKETEAKRQRTRKIRRVKKKT